MAFNLKFPPLFGSSPKQEKSESQQAKTESTGLLAGWPFVNYGADRYAQAQPLYIPRPKYTWLAEIEVNNDYLTRSGRLVTNIDHFLENGNKLYLHLKRIDHPKPNVTTETLRSYNKYVKLQTKVEYPPAQMTFDDDATSIVVALWKEYFAFYSHAGDIGFQTLRNANLTSVDEDNAISIDEQTGEHGYGHLVSVEGTEPRKEMDIRHSIGMRMKANRHRHFFDRITVYDLGTEPDSVNVYYYYRPVITAFDHGDLDWEDRTGKVEANVTFEYENYYFALGRNRSQVGDVIERITGRRPQNKGGTTASNGAVSTSHGDMVIPDFPDLTEPASKTDRTPTPINVPPQNPTFGEPEPTTDPDKTQQEIDDVTDELFRTIERCSSTRDEAGCRKEEAALRQRLEELEETQAQQRRAAEKAKQDERNNPQTRQALQNTEANDDLCTSCGPEKKQRVQRATAAVSEKRALEIEANSLRVKADDFDNLAEENALALEKLKNGTGSSHLSGRERELFIRQLEQNIAGYRLQAKDLRITADLKQAQADAISGSGKR